MVIDDSATIGAVYDSGNKNLKVGEVLTVKQGKTMKILAYNGDAGSSSTFTLAFRNALYLSGAALSAVAATILVYF